MARITARQRILAYIRRVGPVSAGSIGQALGMSAATVRYHLGVLTSDGRIETDSTIESGRLRGRPRKFYRLSDSIWGDNMAMLSSVLLEIWARSRSKPTESRADVKALADTLREHMGPLDETLAATKRIEQLVENLKKAHYEARWEAGAQGPRIIFGRCPYAEIIDEHPYLCDMDRFLLGGAMDADVEQRAKIRRKAGESDRCIFVLRRAAGRGG